MRNITSRHSIWRYLLKIEENRMKNKIQLQLSGISLIDSSWGGFYQGGTYLLIGSRKSGRTLLALKHAMESVNRKEVCLYFTTKRPKDLIILAASIGFDIQDYMDKDLIIVIRVSPPSETDEITDPDHFYLEYLNNIVTVTEQYQPANLIFDDITPFVGFRNLNLLQESFFKIIEAIEEFGTTSLFVLGEPATSFTEKIVEALTENVTAVIYLHKNKETGKQLYGGKMVITPNIGHTQGKFSSDYIIEPNKGVTTYITFVPPGPGLNVALSKDYKTSSPTSSKTNNLILHTNFYEHNDFILLLNNQIALYKSTGQVFTILSFRLDKEAESKGLMTVNQLQQAVGLSTDRKDKICVITNNVVVLITREENSQRIKNLITKIKSNLPSKDPKFIKAVTPHISVYAVKVDENVHNANDLLELLVAEKPQEKTRLGL